MVKRARTVRAIAIAVLAAAAPVVAQEAAPARPAQVTAVPLASSPNYTLQWAVLDANGGGSTASTGYRAEATIGQTAIGSTAGSAGSARMGFWYGVDRNLFSDAFESGDTTAWDSSVGE